MRYRNENMAIFIRHSVKHIEAIPADECVSMHMLYVVQNNKYYNNNYYHPVIFICTAAKIRLFVLTGHMFGINSKESFLFSLPVQITWECGTNMAHMRPVLSHSNWSSSVLPWLWAIILQLSTLFCPWRAVGFIASACAVHERAQTYSTVQWGREEVPWI